MLTFAVAVLVLGFLVLVHELGHFIAAKLSGMKVEQFSIGMGPRIASIQKGETEYIIGAVPAGGFVRVAGAGGEFEDDGDELAADDPRRYPNRPILHRTLFAAAGPAMNILTTIVLLMVVSMAVGVSQPRLESAPVIADISEDSAAQHAGLQVGDEIKAINGEAVNSWAQADTFLAANTGETLNMTIMRDGETQEIAVTPLHHPASNRYMLGVTKQLDYETRKLGVQEAFGQSMAMTREMSTMILDAVGNLVTGQASVSDDEEGLTGPVGIVKIIDESAKQGFWNVLILTSILSVNLGLINLLPIPALDGSRLVFLLLEAIRGKPIDAEKEGLVNFVGFLFLMFLMIYVTFNDIVRLVS